ncbi:FRAS1-related extracellular matrix protein 2-like [Amphiura filiformis]|uniref:FRAS1-related extracellular matrix protein 2-like n=1 Tax=Amphiura filiformis TaxID=82378 RepID=UPI003B216D22
MLSAMYGFMECAGTTFEITETTGPDIDFNFCLCKGPPNPSGAKFFVTIDHSGGANPTEAADFDEGADPIIIEINNIAGQGARCGDNSITILGDSLPENTETFTLTLTFENCEDNDENPCMFDTNFESITVNIVDDDSTPPVENKACDCDNLTVIGLTATGTADYVNFGTVTIDFAANEFTMTHDITINSDDLFEGTEDFLIFLSNPGPDVVAPSVTETLGDLTTAVVSIYDADTIGTWYYLGCAEYTVPESTAMIDIVVNRRGDTSSATSGFVELSTTDITALSTSDYTALTSVPVDFAADDTSSTPITLMITDDMSEEPLEHLQIALTLTAIADESALADLNKAFVTIIDDDSKVTWYSLDCGFYTATETDSGTAMILITITKRGDLSQGTTVLLSTMDITATGGVGLDYTIKMDEPITFAADTETVKTSQLVILSDDIAEGNEYLEVALSLPSTPPAGDALSDVNKALVIIYDDDTPVTWYSLDCGFYTATETDAGTVMILITITKRGDLSQGTTVLLSTMDLTATGGVGLDYTIKMNEPITFAADTETVKTSQLVILSDDIAEGNEYLEVALSLPSTPPAGDALSDVNKALVIIYDDDTPVTWYSLDCGFYTATETDAGTAMILITITKRGDLSQGTTVLLSTMDITATGGVGLDYTIKMNEPITFAADTETVKTSQLIILSDDITEGNEYLEVALSLPSTPPAGDALSDVNKALVIIYDDDEPVTWYSLDCGFYTATETDSGTAMILITITKRGDLSQGTTVLLSTMDITATGGVGLDYTIKLNEPITFAADTETVKTSQLIILSDDIAEGNEYLQVALSLPSSPPAGDALSDVNKALVIIYDDDAPVLSTMDITATGGVGLDYTIKLNEPITFAADTETVKTSQLIILSDDIAEGNEYFQVALSLPSSPPAGDALSDVNKALVIIYDDDAPGNMFAIAYCLCSF